MGGEARRTLKQGLLVQLAKPRVRRIILEVHAIEIQRNVEITLNGREEAMPPEEWKNVQVHNESIFLAARANHDKGIAKV